LEGDGRGKIRAFLIEITQRTKLDAKAPHMNASMQTARAAQLRQPSVDAFPEVRENFRQTPEAVVTPAFARRAAPPPPPPPAASAAEGESVTLGGKYRLGQPLRAGASVYAAVQAGLEKTLAVKVLR